MVSAVLMGILLSIYRHQNVTPELVVEKRAVASYDRRKKRRNKMLVCDYIVERIDGDYAMLKRTNLLEEEEKMVARALLPEEIREGSRLHYELLQYTIVE